MDKEQFDHIEIFFRQAAMNVSPPVSEDAWKRMEVLLDREFQKKRRRAIIWWWPMLLFCLLLGAGITFYYKYSQSVNNKNGITGTSPLLPHVDKTESRSEKRGLQQRTRQQDNRVTSNQSMFTHPQHQPEPSVATKQPGQDAEKQPIPKNNQTSGVGKSTIQKVKKNSTGPSDIYQVRYRQALNTVNVGYTNNDHSRENALKGKITLPELVSDSGIQQGPINHQNSFLTKALTDTSLVNLGTNLSNTSVQLKKIRRFYFVAAVASDASAVGKINLNKFNSRLGLGAGYQLSKKFSLQTGIYAGRMIYTAGDGDYTIKPGSYISKIIRINADCYFYNIPLSLRYNALQLKRYDLYIVGGSSSFWSKKETYDYHFLNRSSAYRRMVSTYKNNKNLFSTIHLSVGLERSLTKVLYVQAEPYLLVPVSGVGEGKVKLQSTGLQVGIKYMPLRK